MNLLPEAFGYNSDTIFGSDIKESACSEEDLGSIPGLGTSPGGGHGNPLQCSCLEKSHGQRSLVGYSPWGCRDMTEVTEHSTAHINNHCVAFKATFKSSFLSKRIELFEGYRKGVLIVQGFHIFLSPITPYVDILYKYTTDVKFHLLTNPQTFILPLSGFDIRVMQVS